ncbi:MAG: FAD-dependent oxidoreductase [Alphaproteobacteria bacterium]
MEELKLKFNINFEDLYSYNGLAQLDHIFVNYLLEKNITLYNILVSARKTLLSKLEYSNLITGIAPYLEEFIVELFNIDNDYHDLKAKHFKYNNLYACKRLFVQRRALKSYSKEAVEHFDIELIEEQLVKLIGELNELNFANYVMSWIEKEDHDKLDIAAKYAAWASLTEEGKEKYSKGIIFNTPHKIDPANLIPVETEIIDGITILKAKSSISRDGFDLTDQGASLKKCLDHANYCIYCHNQNKDSCSIGMREKDGQFKINAQNDTLIGCPLEEKISEMNYLKSQSYSIGALAAAAIDNPMLAATGHRICNDCMKSCIYQKQEPVNVPQIETRVLKDVLSIPWGFEIYSLLTRWNPLNLTRPIPKKTSNYKILVAGLGPAGFTLSHHLLNEGHIVVGIDGLKIEPISSKLSGVTAEGNKTNFYPIKDVNSIYEPLSSRTQAGFGGVAEYGITVRWNKNFLKIIRILLERRENFNMIGGVRLESNITSDQAFNLGFDHIALALGAGAPTILNIPNSMSRGVRAASDFLMSLQLTGAAKEDSIANLQLRLPVIVIGGGLTAIDTATEALAYYPTQVEKFLKRYENSLKVFGIEKTRQNWTEEDTIIAEEFINHATLIREEKKKNNPNVLELINEWGGVKIAYRQNFKDSPSYRFNAEEVELALKEGIQFIPNIIPLSIKLDQYGHAQAIETKDNLIFAKTILFATGTKANTIITNENPSNYILNGNYLQALDISGKIVNPEKIAKPKESFVITAINEDNKATSFIGDLHPSYQGNVVKAMASAKAAYPIISNILNRLTPNHEPNFIDKINNLLRAKVHKVNRLTENIVEVIISAPLAVENFKPGQFFRLQNFEYFSKNAQNLKLSMEGLALTGAIAYQDQGHISLIVLEMGGSSNLCAYLKEDEPVILMGPTGSPTKISANKTILLAGGGLGNAVLFSIGKAFRAQNSKVIYFAGYKKLSDRYKSDELEQAADIIVWCCEEGELQINRNSDKSFHGNIVEAINAYASGALGETPISINDVDEIIAIGSDKMMEAVKEARHNLLKPYLKQNHEAIASINSPMQCMMKEICAQCIQKHIDKDTGLETYIYSCNNQDQAMDKVDFNFLSQRLKQNSVQEKLTSQLLKEYLNKA